MQLTYFTDYCFRVLIHLAQHPDQKFTIDQLHSFFGISRNHLVKVIHWLGQHDYIATSRGKGGGVLLNLDPTSVNIGELFVKAEQRLDLAECMGTDCQCKIVASCGLQGVIRAGLTAFLDVLSDYSLADIAGISSAAVGKEQPIEQTATTLTDPTD